VTQYVLSGLAIGAIYALVAVGFVVMPNASKGALRVILEDEDPAHFTLTDFAFAWRGFAFDADAIAEMRENALQSIGSCSFEEPVHDLRALRMLT
jgi:hypothetical protein